MKAILKDLYEFIIFLPRYQKSKNRREYLQEKINEYHLWSLQNVNNPHVWNYEEFVDISEFKIIKK